MSDSVQIAGFILAGGESSRMGSDKWRLELDGSPLVVRAVQLLGMVTGPPTIIGSPQAFRSLGLQAIADDAPGSGPLGGIATALCTSTAAWNLIIACDLPYLTVGWLRYLAGRGLASAADAVVPVNDRGVEPLCAMYHKRSEAMIRVTLDRGTRRITEGLARLRTEHIDPAQWKPFDSDGLLFRNMNSPSDYEEAKARIKGRVYR